MGHARVTIARWNDKRGITVTNILVDTYCLGVKDVMEGDFHSLQEFENFIPALYFDAAPQVIPFTEARSIVCGAIHYARGLGFEPHSDFQKAGKFLKSDAFEPDGSVSFGGPAGKPLYCAGPYDDADEIMRTLEAHVGKGGFEFIIPSDLDEFLE